MLKINKLLAVIILFFFVISCGSGGGEDDGASTGNDSDSDSGSVSSVIGPDGGVLTTPNGNATLSVPSGALVSDIIIIISQSTERDPLGGIINSYEFRPDGIIFNTPVTISLKYNPNLVPEGVNEVDLKLAYESGGELVIIPDSIVDNVNRIVSGKTTHFTKYSITFPRLPHGQLIGTFNSVEIYSNGNITYNNSNPNVYNYVNGNNTGLQWECVEFVNRYYLQVYGQNIRVAGTHAKDYYKTASERGLIAFPNDGSVPPQVGDIVVSEGDGTLNNLGHVAIVREVLVDKIYVTQQNNFNSAADLKAPLSINRNMLGPFNGSNSYPIKGFLRMPIPITIYASSGVDGFFGSTGPSDLYSVEPTANGIDAIIGRIKTSGGFEPVITDLALAPDGTLYGVSFDTLYTIDKTTAIATPIGNGLGFPEVNALASDSNGNLFAATGYQSGTFLSVDPITGQATAIGSYGSGFGSAGDLAFSPGGTVYAAVSEPWVANTVLVTVNSVTGTANRIDPNLDTGFQKIWGLTFVGNELFGLGRDPNTGNPVLIIFDTSTRQGSYVRDITFTPFGASSFK